MYNVETNQSLNLYHTTGIQVKQKDNINKNQDEENIHVKKTTLDAGTTISNINFLNNNISQNIIVENLNKEIPKDTISTSTGTSSNNSGKKSFAGKTKEWAGNKLKSLKNMKLKKYLRKLNLKKLEMQM